MSPIRRLKSPWDANYDAVAFLSLTLRYRFLHFLAEQLVHPAGQRRGEGVAQLLAQLLLELLLKTLAFRHDSPQFGL